MSDIDTRTESAPAQAAPPGRLPRLLGHAGADLAIATVWAALIIAIVLFSGVVSQFAYVDF